MTAEAKLGADMRYPTWVFCEKRLQAVENKRQALQKGSREAARD